MNDPSLNKRSFVRKLLIALLVSFTVWTVLWNSLPQVSWQFINGTWMIWGAGASLVIWLLRACRLWVLRICSLSTALKLVAIHGGLLRVTPMRLGELSLPVLLHRWQSIPVAQSATLLIWIRLSELICLLIAAIWALLSFTPALTEATPSFKLLALDHILYATILTLLALSICFRYVKPALDLLSESVLKWSIQREWKIVIRYCERIQNGQAKLPNLSWYTTVQLIGISAFIWVFQLLLFSTFLKACGEGTVWASLSLEALTLGSTSAHLGGVVPLPTIGNVGSHEIAWSAGFMWVGVPKESAILSALLSQVVTLIFALLWWGLAYFLPLPSKEAKGRCVQE